MKDILTQINNFSQLFLDFFNKNSNQYLKAEIEKADGRKEKNIISQLGSFLYVVFDEKDTVLYVGETGTSLKNRFISDGGGSHKQKNKNWYSIFKYIKILKLDSNDMQVRKLLEQSLSISMQPKYYDGKIYNKT